MNVVPFRRPGRLQFQHRVEHAHPDPFATLIAGSPHVQHPLHGMRLGIRLVLVDQQFGGAAGVETADVPSLPQPGCRRNRRSVSA